MGFAENFEDLQIWQRARVLNDEIAGVEEAHPDADLIRRNRAAPGQIEFGMKIAPHKATLQST